MKVDIIQMAMDVQHVQVKDVVHVMYQQEHVQHVQVDIICQEQHVQNVQQQ